VFGRIQLPLVFYLKKEYFFFAVFIFKISVKSSPADAGFFADRVYTDCIKVLGFHEFDQCICKTQFHKRCLILFHEGTKSPFLYRIEQWL
jgi:hypothetical protein